jgi:hypothetical protein
MAELAVENLMTHETTIEVDSVNTGTFNHTERLLNKTLLEDTEIANELSDTITARVHRETSYPSTEVLGFNPFAVNALDSVDSDIHLNIQPNNINVDGEADARTGTVILHRDYNNEGLYAWIDSDISGLDRMNTLGHELYHLRFSERLLESAYKQTKYQRLRRYPKDMVIQNSKGMRFMDECLAISTGMYFTSVKANDVSTKLFTYPKQREDNKDTHLTAMMKDFEGQEDLYADYCNKAANLVFALNALGTDPYMITAELWTNQVVVGIQPQATAQEQMDYLLGHLEKLLKEKNNGENSQTIDDLRALAESDIEKMHSSISSICRNEMRKQYTRLQPDKQPRVIYDDPEDGYMVSIVYIPDLIHHTQLAQPHLKCISFELNNLGVPDWIEDPEIQEMTYSDTSPSAFIFDPISGSYKDIPIKELNIDPVLLTQMYLQVVEGLDEKAIKKIVVNGDKVPVGQDQFLDLVRAKH